jgi:hydroxyacylglutathione hydrolase
MAERFHVRAVVSPGFGQNSYVAWGEGSDRAVFVDCGSASGPMLRVLQEQGLQLEAVLLTHAHLDHVDGLARVVEATGAPVYLHPADRLLLDNAPAQARMFGMHVDQPPPPDQELEHGQVLELAGATLHVRHVPGHSPGHVLFHVPEGDLAFVGDIVFQGSIGRTDLPGGDFGQLISGIREQVFSLPGNTTLFTGHGPSTTVGHEQSTNPFLIPHFGGGLA